MILRNSTRNRFLNPVTPVSTGRLGQSGSAYNFRPQEPQWLNFLRELAQPVIGFGEELQRRSPLPGDRNQRGFGGQVELTAQRAEPFARNYMTGAAYSGGLAQVGELAGHAIGQSVLNRAFSVAQGGGPLASYATALAKRIALGPGEAAASVLGNVGHLAGTALAVGPGSRKPQKPINPKVVLAPIIKKYMPKPGKASGGSRAI